MYTITSSSYRLRCQRVLAACLTLSVGIGIADRLVDWRLSEVVRLTYQDVLGSLSLHPERASSSSRLGRISAVSVDTLR